MIIFLDMDEVLVDFTGGAAKVFGLTVKEMGEKFGSWCSGDDFWLRIRDYGERRFWEELEPLPWIAELLSFVRAFDERWMIVSAAKAKGRDGSCYSAYVGKLRWIQKWFPPEFDRFEIVSNKYLLAREGRLLIDDSKDNCDMFRKMGGEAILFPSRFNEAYMHYSDPLGYLEDQISLVS
jgi:FMN phosphatase YigB (HAD superfamily)